MFAECQAATARVWYDFVRARCMDAEVKDILTKLVVSVVIGLIIGGEREYRNKSAGLRTIILICLGSTIFTILSVRIGDETGASRVAANIVTGIGFLGAGAIMRDGLSISGLTTASTIWVAAALGMAVGIGEYGLALSAMALAFVVLTAFNLVQERIFRIVKKTIELHITLKAEADHIGHVEKNMEDLALKFIRKKEMRKESDSIYQYEVIGKEAVLNEFISRLKKMDEIKSFEY